MININAENINEYYDKINNLIDKYFIFNISPVQLYTYFKNKNNMQTFIERNELDQISEIERIVSDIVTDRVAEVSETIKKFENFTATVYRDDFANIFKNVNYPNVTEEKNLADFLGISMGYLKDSGEYDIENTKDNTSYYIFSKENIEQLKKNITEGIMRSIKTQKMSLSFYNFEFVVNDLFREINSEKISNLINQLEITKTFKVSTPNIEFAGEYKNYYIWKL